MQDKRIYTINSSKLDMAYLEGFEKDGDGLKLVGDQQCHVVIFNRFRSFEAGTKWGRFKCSADLSPNDSIRILALASDGSIQKADELNGYFHDQSVPWSSKRVYFEQSGTIFSNHNDVLLYDLAGEYLWLAIEIDKASVEEKSHQGRIDKIKLDSQGDNFMATFPEIYQEEGGFFHRYMSIFSSIYQDMSDELMDMERYLDIETTSVNALTEITSWLGFEARENFLEERMLRNFVGRIYELNRIKGTKKVMQEIIKVILDQDAVVLERNKMENHIPTQERDIYKRLYGDSINDVVILVKHKEDEKLHAQLMVILDEFKPVRSRIKLVFSSEGRNLDSYCYMDYNATLDRKVNAAVDGKYRMNGMVMLQ
jgi:phage tail-like protein